MRRTPRYEIRLAAFYADNLMNSVAHCGWFYLRDIVEEKCRLRPACRKLPGLSKEKTRITPRLSETSGAQQRKNTNFALLVGNFRDSAEKNTNYAPLVGNFRGSTEKNVNYRAFRNVGYNKCRDVHRGRMFRLLWTFVDLKLPSAMSHAIHKIVSIKRCQSYFISRHSRFGRLPIPLDSSILKSNISSYATIRRGTWIKQKWGLLSENSGWLWD